MIYSLTDCETQGCPDYESKNSTSDSFCPDSAIKNMSGEELLKLKESFENCQNITLLMAKIVFSIDGKIKCYFPATDSLKNCTQSHFALTIALCSKKKASNDSSSSMTVIGTVIGCVVAFLLVVVVVLFYVRRRRAERRMLAVSCCVFAVL